MTKPEEKINVKNGRLTLSGLILITLGIIFLLNNFNFLPWSIWDSLWRFWPLFIIFWGLNILFNDSFIGEILVTLITLLLLVFIIFQILSFYNNPFRNWVQQRMPWMPMYQQMFMFPDGMQNNYF